jgi:hypothetical protein
LVISVLFPFLCKGFISENVACFHFYNIPGSIYFIVGQKILLL